VSSHRSWAVIGAASLALLGASWPSSASAATVLYLSQVGTDCQHAVFALTRSSADTAACAIVPRLVVNGAGLNNAGEDFRLFVTSRSAKIDTRARMRGRFSIAATSPAAAGPTETVGAVEARFRVLVNGIEIGTVDVSGVSVPATPVAKQFSLPLPRGLSNQRLRSVEVTVRWVTCAPLPACSVEVGGAAHSEVQVPLR
jgi:hypothetical protein